MAWLQNISSWFTTEEPKPADDLEYLQTIHKRDLHPDLNERHRQYVGQGSKERDKDELQRLRTLWDNDQWRRQPDVHAQLAPLSQLPSSHYYPRHLEAGAHENAGVDASASSRQAHNTVARWDPMRPTEPPSKPPPAAHMHAKPLTSAREYMLRKDAYSTVTTVQRTPGAGPADLRQHLSMMQTKADKILQGQHLMNEDSLEEATKTLPAPPQNTSSFDAEFDRYQPHADDSAPEARLRGVPRAPPVVDLKLEPPPSTSSLTAIAAAMKLDPNHAAHTAPLGAGYKHATSATSMLNSDVPSRPIPSQPLLDQNVGPSRPEPSRAEGDGAWGANGLTQPTAYQKLSAVDACFSADYSVAGLSEAARQQGSGVSAGATSDSVIQGWSREKLVDLAKGLNVNHQDMSDEELFANVRTHILKDLGLDPTKLVHAHPAPETLNHFPTDNLSVSQPASIASAQLTPAHPEDAQTLATVSQHPAGGGMVLLHDVPSNTQDEAASNMMNGMQGRVESVNSGGQAMALVPHGELAGLQKMDTVETSGLRSLAEILHSVGGDGRIGAATSIRILVIQQPKHKDAAAELQVLPPLVDMVKSGSPQAISAACGALQKLCAHHPQNQMALVSLRGTEALVKVAWGEAGSATDEGRKLAVLTLRNMSNLPGTLEVLTAAGVIPPLVKLVELAAQGSVQGRSRLSEHDRVASLAAVECMRNMTAVEAAYPPSHYQVSALGGGKPGKLMCDAGLAPMLSGMLRATTDNRGWCAVAGLINNLCVVWADARSPCMANLAPAYLAEALMCGNESTREAASAALWAVHGLAPPPSQQSPMSFERVDAPPVCWTDGVQAVHHGHVVSEAWWDPPIIPLVRMLRDGQDLGREAACAALASACVHRTTTEDSLEPGSETAMVPAGVVPAEEAGNLDARRKRRQAAANAALEAEATITPVPQTQEAAARATAVTSLVEILARGTACTTQPAAALLMDALAVGSPLVAARAVADGALPALARMLASGSPFGKAAAAAALCSLSEDREAAAFVLRAGAAGQLVLLLTCGDTAGRLQAARTLLRLAMHAPEEVGNCGAVPALVQELAANMAGGAAPKGPGSARVLLRKELAMCALLVLCRGSPDRQLFASRAGAVGPLAALMESPGERCARAAAALMEALTQHHEACENVAKVEASVPALVRVASDQRRSPEARASAAASLWRLSLDSPPRAVKIYRAGGLEAAMALLRMGSVGGGEGGGAHARARSAGTLLLGELAFCVDVQVMEETAGMVLNMLQEKVGSGAAEACLTVQRIVSRGMRANDPRVVVHKRGECARNQQCDVCYTQGVLTHAIPTLLRHISGFDYNTDKARGLMTGVPESIKEQVDAVREAAVGALHVLVEHNFPNVSKAVTGGALLEVAELMSRAGTTGGRIESATALNSLCVAGGPAIRLKAPTVGLLVPTLELCEAGMHVNDAFMSMHSDSATEKSRLEVWQEAPAEVLVEAYQAGSLLLATLAMEKENCLSISVCRPKALDPIVRLAARGGTDGATLLDPHRSSIAFSPTTLGVQEYTENACRCLMYLCGQQQLHFLLSSANAIVVLLRRVQDKQYTTAEARNYSLRALLFLGSKPSPVEAAPMSKPKIPVPSEMQSHLLQEGGLEAAVDVLRWAQEENVKTSAALLAANLAEVATGVDRERVILSMKQPLIILKNEVATCDDSRNAADAALVVLIGVEQRAAQSWTMNNHGQTVATGEYPSAQLGDMDLLD